MTAAHCQSESDPIASVRLGEYDFARDPDCSNDECKSSNHLGGNSQKFLRRILKIFVFLSFKILILLRFKEVFETDILKFWC